MELKTILKADVPGFVDRLRGQRRVYGVTARGNRYDFTPLEAGSDLVLEYDVTLTSPKKFLLPAKERLMRFTLGKQAQAEASVEAESAVLLGVHPYDLHAIAQLDALMSRGNPDVHYLNRRQKLVLIGVDIVKPGPRSFCADMGTTRIEQGFDQLWTLVGDRYVVALGTELGASLAQDPAFRPATPLEVEGRESTRQAIDGLYQENRLAVKREEIPALMTANYRHPVWEHMAEKCLSCGSCNLVCPTCYCFDVQDEVNLKLTEGARVRTWDGCLLKNFTLVAGGEVFREHRADRYRHRLLRKGQYLPEKHGFNACVGCGRCATACLPDIANPVEVINALAGSHSA